MSQVILYGRFSADPIWPDLGDPQGLEIDWIAGDVHESADDIHTCSPLQLKLFPVGLRLRTVLPLDIQPNRFVRHKCLIPRVLESSGTISKIPVRRHAPETAINRSPDSSSPASS